MAGLKENCDLATSAVLRQPQLQLSGKVVDSRVADKLNKITGDT